MPWVTVTVTVLEALAVNFPVPPFLRFSPLTAMAIWASGWEEVASIYPAFFVAVPPV